MGYTPHRPFGVETITNWSRSAMFRVKNLSPGRVQIRTRGRATNGGDAEIVQSIDPRLIRLRDAGLISWGPLVEDLGVKPSDVVAAVAAVVAPVKQKPEPEKSEILKLAGEGLVKAVLPVTEVVADAPESNEPEPDIELADDSKGVADDDEATAPDELPAPAAEDVKEPPVEPEDQRITFERERLSAGDWKDIKAEAKDKGIKGRTRDTIEERLLELFVTGLS